MGMSASSETETAQRPAREPTLRVMPMPPDVNHNGDIFGGWIMAQVDIAGGVHASRRANGRVATVAVNSFVFKKPVLVGDLVSFYTKLVRTGNTSITIEVEVFAARFLNDREKTALIKVTDATLTYVAIGLDRRPRQLPPSNEAED
jgi:acyl-CoA thioesterase YciA